MTLAISDDTLKYEVGRLLNWGPVSEWTEEDNQDYTYIKNAALQEFYWPSPMLSGGKTHVWSFLTPTFTLVTSAPYATGTVTVASGVVTLVGGTFPSWVASGELDLGGASDGPFEISTRDSDTQLTLVDTDVNEATAVNYVVARYRYDLPGNYGGPFGPLTFRAADLHYSIREIEFITYEHFRVQRQNWSEERSYPRRACETLQRIQYDGAVNTDVTELQTRELLLGPTPDAAYHLSMRYMINPQTLEPSDILGAELYPQAVRHLVLAEAERSKDHPTPKYAQKAAESLQQAIHLDRQRYMPDTAGYFGDRSDRPLDGDPYFYYRTSSVSHENDV